MLIHYPHDIPNKTNPLLSRLFGSAFHGHCYKESRNWFFEINYYTVLWGQRQMSPSSYKLGEKVQCLAANILTDTVRLLCKALLIKTQSTAMRLNSYHWVLYFWVRRRQQGTKRFIQQRYCMMCRPQAEEQGMTKLQHLPSWICLFSIPEKTVNTKFNYPRLSNQGFPFKYSIHWRDRQCFFKLTSLCFTSQTPFPSLSVHLV